MHISSKESSKFFRDWWQMIDFYTRFTIAASLTSVLVGCQANRGAWTDTTKASTGAETQCRSALTGELYTIHNAGCSTGDTPVSGATTSNSGPATTTETLNPTNFREAVDAISPPNPSEYSNVIKVFKYAANLEKNSNDLKYLRKKTPSMKLPMFIIDKYVSPLFPDLAKQMLEKQTITVSLSFSPEDLLLEEDIATAIKYKIPYITIKEAGKVKISIKKALWSEEKIPQTSNTVMYPTYQVDILASALLMPRNSTYMYDVTNGGYKLEYAFEVRATGGSGAPYRKLVRKSDSVMWHSCANARIQNVFGGVSPAGFMANDHMRQLCSNSSGPADSSSIRSSAVLELVNAIKQIPAIEAVGRLN